MVPRRMQVFVCSVVRGQDHVSDVVHEDSFYNWHERFSHQSHDAIEALVAKPGSDIKLTDRTRPNFMTCAEKNKEPTIEEGQW
jgi:hypothetical protein